MRFFALASVLLTVDLAYAVDDAETLARSRVRAGAWLGPGLLTGRLELRAPTAQIDTDLTAVPVISAGAEVWPTEAMGLVLALDAGLGAEIELPDAAGRLDYNLHQLRLGGRYRWHLGPEANASALVVGLGLRGLRQSVQTQRPPLLVDRIVAGPELDFGFEWVITPELWTRVGARAGIPFFVRETPADSGDPHGFVAYGLNLEVVLKLAGDWALQSSTNLQAQGIDFRGEGTRAGRVEDASTDDRFITFALAARYAL